MLARAAGWNPSIFSPNGKIELDTVIKKYLVYAVKTNNPFTFNKYVVQYMLRELQETPLGKQFLQTFSTREIWYKNIISHDISSFAVLMVKT